MTMDAHLAPGNRSAAADFRPRHFAFAVEGRVGVVTLNRPERKNPLTFDSYAELRDLFRLLARRRRRPRGRHRRRGRQLLLGRRRARDHRAADEDGDARPAGVHAHDRRPGQGDARLPAADRRGDRRRVRRRRRHPRDGVRPARRHRAQQGRVPVHPRRSGRLRHGRVRDAAAHHRPGPRVGAALHRPRDERRGSARAGASTTASSSPTRSDASAVAWRRRARRRPDASPTR